MKIVKYETNKEKKDITFEKVDAGLLLIEESLTFQGNFLIFATLEEFKDIRVRPERNRLLAETDHLMLSDAVDSFTVDEYDKIKEYRQALRDLPEKIKSSEVLFPSCEVELKVKSKSLQEV